MSIFSIDESGYTGRNLLEKSQPWQGACAVNISHDDASYLIKQHFPNLKASELKFNSLKRRDGNQKPLFALQQDLLANFPCVISVANKRFLLILLFIEYAVEPFYHDKGINLYENGDNFSMASMAYYVCPSYFDRGFDDILRAFQNAVHQKTPTAVNALIASVRAVNWQLLPEVLGPLALAHPDCIEAIMNPYISTDAAFIILQSLISRTELMSDGPYCIEHDRSDNLLQYKEYLSMLIKCQTPAKFKMSEIVDIQFPLKLKDVLQVDSKLSPSVQLCDVLIGGAISGVLQLAQNKPLSCYSPLKLYNDDQIIHFCPDIDFEEQKKFRRDSQGDQLIDFIADQIHKSRS